MVHEKINRKFVEEQRQDKSFKWWLLEILGALWALPVTLIGLLALIGCLGWTKKIKVYPGLRISFQPRKFWFIRKKFKAMNLGSVFFFKDIEDNIGYYKTLIHEDEHRRQCYILGPFIIIIYPLLALLALILYNKEYRANWLEICARWKARQGLNPDE